MLHPALLPVLGFLIGFFVITIGGGGGAFYVGILTGLFGVPPAVAASTSLATMIPTTATGAFSHYRAGNLNVRLGLFMLAGGAAGAVIGSLFSGSLPEALYARISGIFMVGLSLQMLRQFFKKPAAEKQPTQPGRGAVAKALLYGAFGGLMSGLVGLSGSGPIIVGLSVLGCSVMEMVGTSVFVLLGVSATGFLMHLNLGDIDWPLVGLLLIGTASGALIGPTLLKKANRKKMEAVLKPVLFALTLGMGILMIFQ